MESQKNPGNSNKSIKKDMRSITSNFGMESTATATSREEIHSNNSVFIEYEKI